MNTETMPIQPSPDLLDTLTEAIHSFRFCRAIGISLASINLATLIFLFPKDSTAGVVASLLATCLITFSLWQHRSLNKTLTLFSQYFPSLPQP